jgi:putative DNA primase/helicase
MACKPLTASNITAAALFRAIDTCRPTLFIDEADTFLAGNGTLRGLINSGNTWRTAYVLRLSRSRPSRHRQSLKNSEPGVKKYSCWCPKVIAMIGRAPDTIADRSIVIPMARKLVTETCAPLAELDTAEIKSKCARFALDAAPAIAQSAKIRGEGLNDRAADTFDPLYVITRLAGAEWETKLHAAAIALASPSQPQNSGAELLLDLFALFIRSGREKIFSRDLVSALREGGCGLRSPNLKSSPINEFGISQILHPYGIKPTTIRIGKEVNRGYVGAEFRDALRRYVPKAEVLARMEEIHRHSQLQAEASAEAKKEAALRVRVPAGIPQDEALTASAVTAIPRPPETGALNQGAAECLGEPTQHS